MLQLGWDRWKGIPRLGAPGMTDTVVLRFCFPPAGKAVPRGQSPAWSGSPACPQSCPPRDGCRYPVGTLYKVILTPFLTLCISSRAFASGWGWRFESVC